MIFVPGHISPATFLPQPGSLASKCHYSQVPVLPPALHGSTHHCPASTFSISTHCLRQPWTCLAVSAPTSPPGAEIPSCLCHPNPPLSRSQLNASNSCTQPSPTMPTSAPGSVLYGPFPSSQLCEVDNKYTPKTVVDQNGPWNCCLGRCSRNTHVPHLERVVRDQGFLMAERDLMGASPPTSGWGWLIGTKLLNGWCGV